jgi:hypothetical protein
MILGGMESDSPEFGGWSPPMVKKSIVLTVEER